MITYRMGKYLMMGRKAQSISQEDIADAVCSSETLSRTENGHGRMSASAYCALSKKAGMREELVKGSFFNPAANEARNRFEQSVRRGHVGESVKWFEIMLQRLDTSQMDRVSEEYIGCARGLVDFRRGIGKTSELIKKLKSRLEKNYGTVTPEIVSKYPLSYTDMYMIIALAMCLYYEKESYSAILYLDALIDNIELDYVDGDQVRGSRLAAMTAAAYIMYKEGKYAEAVHRCDKALESCKTEAFYAARLLMIKGESLGRMSNSKETDRERKTLLTEAYYIAMAQKDNEIMGQLRSTLL